MKKMFFAFAALLAGFASVAATGDDEKKIEKLILDQNVTIEINMIIPSMGPSKQTSDGYTLKVADGRVNADLPFFGESHTAIVSGVDEPGIKFDDYGIIIAVDKKKAKKGQYEWMFNAKSGNEDVQVYITLWTSGEAEIRCQPSNRSSISYRGTIITE